MTAQVIATALEVTEVARVTALLERWGERFVARAFSEEEAAYCQRKRRGREECFAARWAAKAAACRALGSGARRWRDYEVTRDAAGRPSLRLHGGAREIAEALGARLHLSLSHDAGLAVAFVVVEAAATG